MGVNPPFSAAVKLLDVGKRSVASAGKVTVAVIILNSPVLLGDNHLGFAAQKLDSLVGLGDSGLVAAVFVENKFGTAVKSSLVVNHAYLYDVFLR